MPMLPKHDLDSSNSDQKGKTLAPGMMMDEGAGRGQVTYRANKIGVDSSDL